MTLASDVAVAGVFRQRFRAVRLGAGAALARAWDGLPAYDEGNVEEWIRRAAPLLAAAEATTLALTRGAFGVIAGGAAPVRPLDVEQDLRHPFIGVWRELRRGRPYAEAVKVGRARAVAQADERSVLAQRHVAREFDAHPGVVGWRRTPHGSTCSWCVVVSTQRYRTAESASFGHGHKGVDYCDCDVLPIVGDRDPGRVINRPMLSAWKRANRDADTAPAYFDADSMDPAPRPDAPAPAGD